jgi:SAM-dependent methyltransferase
MTQNSDYLLGVNQDELERLRFQHQVWGRVTNAFFDRIGIKSGWKCLDVGAGPGFVAMDLRERVGQAGEVTALEPSSFYLDWFKRECMKKGWTNVRFIQGSAETAQLPENQYDFVFSRWVISFATDPVEFLASVLRSLKPGGTIALQDYYYEGLSLFPLGGAFDRMKDVVRAHYRSAGGDPYVAGKIPAILRSNGLKVVDFTPTCLAGGPESGVMEWAHRFFTVHTQAMVDRGLATQKEAGAMLADWHAHRADPNSIFFSPIVVDIAAVLPG